MEEKSLEERVGDIISRIDMDGMRDQEPDVFAEVVEDVIEEISEDVHKRY